MTLNTSLTGSYPPIFNPDDLIRNKPLQDQDRLVRESIERAIRDQIDLGIDILVDGQPREDIVSLFSSKLPGYEGYAIPCHVTGPICPSEEPITVSDYSYAKQQAGDRPLKAHITGPMTMSRGSRVDATSPYASRNDPKLIKDLAIALGQEASFLVGAGAEIIQIDEPVLQDGVDMDLAIDAMKRIVEIGQIPFPALHACGNVTKILKDILSSSPVKMISIEGTWLNHDELLDIDRNYLSRCGKQIGLGCIQVANYQIEKLTRVQNFLDQMVLRLGEENIWAVMPNCGLRPVPYDIARQKLQVMIKAAKSLQPA